MNCVSTADALAAEGLVAAVAARSAWWHVRARLGWGGSRAERRAVAEAETVAFLAGLGLDPDRVLAVERRERVPA